MRLHLRGAFPRIVLSAACVGLLLGASPGRAAGARGAAKKAAAAGAEADPFQSNVEPGRKYVYKQSGGAAQELEVYFPPNRPAAAPAVPGVILFHGGSWSGGNLTQFRHVCQYLANRGLVAATANYRMLTRTERERLPPGESYKRVCITDAKSAIRWMKQHAGELGVDPRRLITGGGSAGGHVAALATLGAGLDDPGDPREFDTRVVAYLMFNPAFRADDAADPEVDVLRQLAAGMAPAIFFFGTEDKTWKPGSDALLEKLRARGKSDAELWLGEGQAHGFFNRAPWQDLTLAEADRFLGRLGLLHGACTLAAPASGEKLRRAP